MKDTHEQEIKRTIRKMYSKIALQETNNESGSSCCAPGCCSSGGGNSSTKAAATVIGYETSELESVPQASVLGAGCGTPVKFANLQKGEIVVDLGSGAGIDVFLSSKWVGASGRIIGIDMTDEMLKRATKTQRKAAIPTWNLEKVTSRKEFQLMRILQM